MAFRQRPTARSLGLADPRLSAVARSRETVRDADGTGPQVRARLQRSDGQTFRGRRVGPVDGTNGVGAERTRGPHRFRGGQRDHAGTRYWWRATAVRYGTNKRPLSAFEL